MIRLNHKPRSTIPARALHLQRNGMHQTGDPMQNPISGVFLAWLQAHGVIAHGIEAAFVQEGGRGIAAQHELPAGMSPALHKFNVVIFDSAPDVSQSAVLVLCPANYVQEPYSCKCPRPYS